MHICLPLRKALCLACSFEPVSGEGEGEGDGGCCPPSSVRETMNRAHFNGFVYLCVKLSVLLVPWSLSQEREREGDRG